MSGYTSLNNWQIESIFENRVEECRIKSESIGMGNEVDRYAKEIQMRFGIEAVPYEDAYEMAYVELVVPKLY
jgi:hypothetical protein